MQTFSAPSATKCSRPDGVEQFHSRQVARASGEVLQQRQRFGGQGYRPGFSVELSPGGIDPKAIKGEQRSGAMVPKVPSPSTW